MSNTATTAYYRQLMQTKNGLAAQGATRIDRLQSAASDPQPARFPR